MISLPPQSVQAVVNADDAVVLRPENRRRHPESALWSDTLPGWFRSEGFAEDLPRNAAAPVSWPTRPAVAVQRRRDIAGPQAALAAVLAVTRVMWARRVA